MGSNLQALVTPAGRAGQEAGHDTSARQRDLYLPTKRRLTELPARNMHQTQITLRTIVASALKEYVSHTLDASLHQM